MKRRNLKAPGFIAARLSLYAVGAAAGAFGVSGWLETMTWDAIVLAVMTGLSIVVVPVACEVVGVNRWSFMLAPVALVFGAINAFSFHHAVDAKIEAPRRAAYQLEVVAPKVAALQAAKDAVAAHAPLVFPETMGPKNVAARQDAWDRAHKPLLDAVDAAKADLEAVPAYKPFVADELVWAIACALDLALAFALAGITLVRASIQKQIDARRAAEAAAREKRNAKAAKITKPKKAKQVVTTREAAALFGPPRLAVDNAV